MGSRCKSGAIPVAVRKQVNVLAEQITTVSPKARWEGAQNSKPEDLPVTITKICFRVKSRDDNNLSSLIYFPEAVT